jgi:hypothetical protein
MRFMYNDNIIVNVFPYIMVEYLYMFIQISFYNKDDQN